MLSTFCCSLEMIEKYYFIKPFNCGLFRECQKTFSFDRLNSYLNISLSDGQGHWASSE
jgi:hypothetical protein